MYTLTLTPEDISDIHFVGGRYFWSEALSECCGEGRNELPEHVAWEILDAFERDTEGGHSFFPMLDLGSELARKLFAFMEAII